MAEATEEMPLISIQEKMFSSWKATIKVCVLIALCCALCGYLYIYIKTYIMKTKRLEQIGFMLMETENMIQNLYALDQNLAADLEELNDYYFDDY